MTERDPADPASNIDHDTDNGPGEFVDTPENEPGDQDEPSGATEHAPEP